MKKRRSGTGAGAKEFSEAWDAGYIFRDAWGMLYVDDTGILSQSPGSSGKVVEVTAKACLASRLTVSELKMERHEGV